MKTMTEAEYLAEPDRATALAKEPGGVVLTRDGKPYAVYSIPMDPIARPLCDEHCDPGHCEAFP